MNKQIQFLLILICFNSIGCTSNYDNGQYQYNNRMYQYKSLYGPQKAMAIAVNGSGQMTGGWGSGIGYSIEGAIINAKNQCKRFNPSSTCVIEWENNQYVLERHLASLEQSKSGECQNIECFTYWLDSRNKIPISSGFYSGGTRQEEDNDDNEYEDDSWFDPGTPQCDEGTWYEINGYC